MKGLGRNIRFMMGRFHESLILTGVIFLFTFIVLNIGNEDVVARMKEAGPLYYLLLMVILILCTIGFGESYLPTIVSVGASRKPTATGMLLSQHIFMLEQLAFLFVVAVLLESSKSMQAVRICPLGTVALLVLILGIGNLFNAIDINGHKLFGVIAGFVLGTSAIVFVLVIAIKCDFNINVEVFRTYNSWWLLLLGLVVDLVGAYFYYKAVTKVDLKLA